MPRKSMKSIYPNAGKHWPDEDIALFAKMYVANESTQKIANALGRSPKAIINQISDAEELITPTGERLLKQIKLAKVNIVMARFAESQQRKPEKHRERWSLGDDLELSLHFGKGVSASDLAERLKRTKLAVIGRLHALGLLSFDKDTMTYYTKPQHYYKIKKAPV